MSIKQIVRRLGHSRNLVRQILRGGRTDMYQTRQRSLDAYYLFLEGQWSGGCRNGAELWRRLQARGFRGSLRSVGEWTTRRRRSEAVSKQQLQRIPSARTIARLMTIRRDCMTKADAVVIAAVEAGVPSLVEPARSAIPRHDPKEGRGLLGHLDCACRQASSHPSHRNPQDRPPCVSIRSSVNRPVEHRFRNSNSSNGKVRARKLDLLGHDCSAPPICDVVINMRQSPDWMPITPKTGSLFHAETQLGGRVETGERLVAALEKAGVEFIAENGGGLGVRLRKPQRPVRPK